MQWSSVALDWQHRDDDLHICFVRFIFAMLTIVHATDLTADLRMVDFSLRHLFEQRRLYMLYERFDSARFDINLQR